ncbi:MAG TPA: DUF4097 family beta strand repeat-containing protein [Candidatus Acidoferrales bacterium]|nr:DUF4097 family beta strand repeat-containing protein [Candidatus Acidoferrales bacterium]
MNKRRRQLSILAAAVAAAVLAAAGAVPARAQSQQQTSADRISVKLTDPSRPALVKASLVNGGITVKAYEGQEVIVEARARHEEPEREASGGLRRLNIARTGLTVEEDNNEVRISTDSYLRPIDLILTVPVRTSLKLGAVNDGDIAVTGVDGEMDVNDVNGSVTLNHVSGNCVAHALNGKVLATFVRVSPQKPMAFSSLNGDIDVTFPPDLKASVVIRSDRGDVFSDFDVQLQASAPQQTVEDSRGHGGKYRVRIDKSVRGTIHGGGPEYQFTNFQGSIYIRKGDAH